MNRRRIIVAVTGASGSVYALKLINYLADVVDELTLIFSENGQNVWNYELDNAQIEKKSVRIVDNNTMFDAVASGSAQYDCMIVIPCSMGTLARIAHGTSENLICRAADVMLKERRKLILVTRETPLSLIHVENMRTVTLAGAIVCPASPSFYGLPKNIDQVVMSVVSRVLDLAGFPGDFYRWG